MKPKNHFNYACSTASFRLRDLVGRPFGPATVFDQSRRFAGLITPQPFTDGVAGAAKLAGGGLDAVASARAHGIKAAAREFLM